MRVFCPSCQEPVTIADELAGKATFCPLCKAAFTAPTLFSPPPAPLTAPAPATTPPVMHEPIYSLEPLPPAPVLPPTTIKPEPRLPPPPPAQPPRTLAPSGSPKMFSIVIPADVIQWTAPAFLIVAVFTTFFSWNGAYPAGHGVYTQSAWGALTGDRTTDPVGDKVLKLDPEKPADDQVPLKRQIDSNLLMIPYLMLLLLTAVLAVVSTTYPMLHLKLPPQVQKILPWRMAIVAGLALILTMLLAIQWARGFGLENALTRMAKAKVTETLSERPTDEEIKTQEIREAKEVGSIRIRHTWWLRVALFAQIGAIFGAGFGFALSRRGERPSPRIDVTW